MSRSPRRIVFTIGGVLGALVLVAIAVLVLGDINRYKPRFEAVATDALGLDVRLGGRLRMGLFPGLHVTAEDTRVLGERGVVLASAQQVRLSIKLLPLLRKELRLRRIELTQPRLTIERDRAGKSNVERLKSATLLGALDGASVVLTGGTLLYVDRRSGEQLEVADLQGVVSHMQFVQATDSRFSRSLSLKAEFACGEIRNKDLAVSAVKVSIVAKNGIFELKPVTLHMFGGVATGDLRADLSGPVADYQARCSLPRFRIEEFLKVFAPKQSAEGVMDFSANLSMRGNNHRERVETTAGEISLHSGQLTLVGTDLDQALSRFESSQSLNLVDVGAVFLVGPLSLAVTKGYNFANLFRGSGGNSRIVALTSDWNVEHGVARAKDVAMATSKNRIALQGGLDFVNERFAEVTVAAIDDGGCVIVRQVIRGAFAKPQVEKPHVLKSLAGPVLKLMRQTRNLLPSGPCEVFYSGAVGPPK